ncbi:MAG: tetratricopeptide repeat protein [Thermoguttaceae bacterium]|nr:tetratricopeptide repeat protein [Thermoguttaceae bacterium]
MRIYSIIPFLAILVCSSFALAQSAPSLDQAKSLQQQGRFPEAIEVYKQLIENDDENVALQLGLADCYLGNRNYSEALMVLYSVIAQDKTVLPAYAKLAQLNAIQLHNVADAQTILDKMTDANPESAEAFAVKAQYLLQWGEKEKALAAAGKMVQLDKSPASALRLLQILIKADKIEEAEKALTELKKEPFAPFMMEFFDAQILMAKKNWTEALSKFESVLKEAESKPELSPIAAQTYEFMGSCCEHLTQYDRQLECFNEALDYNPSSMSAQLGRAMALYHLKRNEDSLAVFNEIKKSIGDAAFFSDPRIRALYLKLELERQSALSPEERIKAQEEFVKQSVDEDNPDDPVSILAQCELLLRQEKVEEARNLLTAALDKDPQKAAYWAALAMVELKVKNFDAASHVIADGKNKIGFSPALLNVELKLILSQDKTAAKEKIDQLVKELVYLPADQKALAFKTVAEAFILLKEYDRVQELLQTVEQLNPKDEMVPFFRMKVAFAANDAALLLQQLGKVQKTFGVESPESYFGQALYVILQVRTGAAPKSDLDKARALIYKAKELRPGWKELQQFRLPVKTM